MPFEFQITDIRNEIFDIDMTLGGAGVVVLQPAPHATVLLALLAVAFCIKICLTVSGRSLNADRIPRPGLPRGRSKPPIASAVFGTAPLNQSLIWHLATR